MFRFFHLNLIYSLRIACFFLSTDDAVSPSQLERISFSSNTLSHVILAWRFFFSLCFSQASVSLFRLSWDNCLFHFAFHLELQHYLIFCECVFIFPADDFHFGAGICVFVCWFFILFPLVWIVCCRLFVEFLCEVFLISGRHHFHSAHWARFASKFHARIFASESNKFDPMHHSKNWFETSTIIVHLFVHKVFTICFSFFFFFAFRFKLKEKNERIFLYKVKIR